MTTSRDDLAARLSPPIALGCLAVTLACFAGAVWLAPRTSGVLAATEGFQARATDIVWLASWLGFPVVGTMILRSRARNPIGWILSLIGLSVGVLVFSTVYARWALAVHGGDVPWGRVAAAVAALTAEPAVFVCFLVFLFPSGRIESGLHRRVFRAGLAFAAGSVIWNAVAPGPIDGIVGEGRVDNPLGVAALDPVAEYGRLVFALLLTGFAALAITRALFRLAASRADERQQMKWFAFSALLFPVTIGVAVVRDPGLAGLMEGMLTGTAMGSETGRWGLPAAFLLSFTGMAVSIGFAILRHRLYDIDRIINRTLVYTLVTAGLAGVYVGAVLGLQRASRPLTGGDDLAVAVSTLLVAAAFVPVRDRLRRFVDRRFNRSRYDAARTVEAFAVRLREEVDLERLGAELLGVAARAARPTSAGLWLRDEISGAFSPAGLWGHSAPAAVEPTP